MGLRSWIRPERVRVRFEPAFREKRFFRADVGYGWDVKAETKEQKNRMLSVGLSYHWALAPYFTFGTGAG